MSLITPADVASTALWINFADSSTLFDATTGGSLVASAAGIARAEDKSGNGRHFIQSGPTSRPSRQVNVQNGLDVARFDGSNDWLESTFAAWGTSYAVIVVGRATNATTGLGSFFVCRSTASAFPINPQVTYNAGTNQFNVRDDAAIINGTNIAGLANNSWYLLGGTRNGNVVTPYRDGTAGTSASNSIGQITTNRTTIGSLYAGNVSPQTFLSGDIGEVIVCGLADRQVMEGYAAWGWGLQGGLPANHPYKNAAPTKASPMEIFAAAHNAVRGAL